MNNPPMSPPIHLLTAYLGWGHRGAQGLNPDSTGWDACPLQGVCTYPHSGGNLYIFLHFY